MRTVYPGTVFAIRQAHTPRVGGGSAARRFPAARAAHRSCAAAAAGRRSANGIEAGPGACRPSVAAGRAGRGEGWCDYGASSRPCSRTRPSPSSKWSLSHGKPSIQDASPAWTSFVNASTAHEAEEDDDDHFTHGGVRADAAAVNTIARGSQHRIISAMSHRMAFWLSVSASTNSGRATTLRSSVQRAVWHVLGLPLSTG